MCNIQRSKLSLAIGGLLTTLLVQTSSMAVAAEESEFALEEIVVTASKRAESLQDSSLVIDAFNGEELANAGISDAMDLSSLVPGLQVGTGGPSLQVYIRGVGNPGSTAVTNPAVAINKGGVYIARSQAVAASFFDLERVEVLKGPQGTLYGRNATGGAVNLITASPDLDEISGFASLDQGSYNSSKLEAALNVPLTDTLAVRGSVLSYNRDGYMSDGSGDEDRHSARLQALWLPTDTLSIAVASQYASVEGMGTPYTYAGSSDPWGSILSEGANAVLLAGAKANGLIVPGQLAFPFYSNLKAFDTGNDLVILGGPTAGKYDLVSLVDPKTTGGTGAFQDMTFKDISATIEWDLDFATLTLIPAYQESTMHYAVNPGLRYETYNVLTDEPETSETRSLEARFSNETDKLKWVTGVYLHDESQLASVHINQGASQHWASSSEIETGSLGVFGEATYSLTDASRLIAGLRYSEDDIAKNNFKRYTLRGTIACETAILQGASFKTFSNGIEACAQAVDEDASVKYDSTDWKLGLEHDWSADNMLFLTVATGYKAGGFSLTASPAFEPEELLAWELGSRNRFMDGRLKLNADVFFWEYTNNQIFKIGPDDLGVVGQSITNAQEASIKGFSIDLDYAVTDNGIFNLGVEYLDATYDELIYQQGDAFTPADADFACTTNRGNVPVADKGATVNAKGTPDDLLTIDCSGLEMNRAADWSGFVGYTQVFDLSNGGYLEARVDMNFTGDRWLSSNFLNTQRAEGHQIWNARLTYTAAKEALSITAYVKNLTEEASYKSATAHSQVPQLVGIAIGEPRTYGLRLRYNF